MNAKKHMLAFSHDKTSVLFGITSNLNEIEFCNLLQTELGINLTVKKQLEVGSVQDSQSYSVYSYHNNETMITYDLVHNRTSTGYIIKFLDTITYFLRCSADYIEIESKNIKDALTSLDAVLFVQKVEDGKFNTKQQIIIQSIFPLR